jgi:hypothetical protein
MTSTPKTPTPQGISALLRKAGFERSESSATRIRGYRRRSEGYSAAKWDDYGSVEVRYHRGMQLPDEADRIRPGMLAAYTEAIRAAGYSVTIKLGDHLIVTAKPASPLDAKDSDPR